MTTQNPYPEIHHLQLEISQLKGENKILRESIAFFHQENKKLQNQKDRLNRDIQKLKSEGHETSAIRAKLVNEHMRKIETAGYMLVGTDSEGNKVQVPHSKFMY